MNQNDFEKGKKQLKYHSKNPVYNYLVNGFNNSVEAFFKQIDKNNKPKRILEIGVGEGQITEICLSVFPDAEYVVADIAEGILEVAKETLKNYQDQVSFEIQDIKRLPYKDESFDLVICCEVLEHVPDPTLGMRELNRVLKKEGHGIMSVPNEPIWRILNMVRGSYLKDFGNTPGHVNHWSSSSFKKAITNQGFQVINNNNPLPWTMIIAKK